MDKKRAIIIGAGPAGLSAAYEILTRTDIKPIIFEATGDIGGIAKSVYYKGNIIDIGGHRYYSKSQRVKLWWESILPLQGAPAKDYVALKSRVAVSNKPGAPDPEQTDRVMLIRNRFSRIFFSGKFVNYPFTLEPATIRNIGLLETIKMALSYIKSKLFQIREVNNLEDFLINRFGKRLYFFFFKSYTEKAWGISCKEISPDWGMQRIKGVSITKLILHSFLRMLYVSGQTGEDSKEIETSLISSFSYPKLGCGQLWEEVEKFIINHGGEIHLRSSLAGIDFKGNMILSVDIVDDSTQEVKNVQGDYFFSSAPLKELIHSFKQDVPMETEMIASKLRYRDFITVAIILKRIKTKNKTKIQTINNIIPDNWIYIQERKMRLARVQIFNNWSPYMTKDQNTVSVGLEYFCDQGDEFWNMPDADIIEFALNEFSKAGFMDKKDLIDALVVRMPKAYPVYDDAYKQLHAVRRFTDTLENLFLIGRNGMHRYNNMDHSILTAMVSVDNIIYGIKEKGNIWSVNTELMYGENT